MTTKFAHLVGTPVHSQAREQLMQRKALNQFAPKQRGIQYLVHLLNDRASSSYVALAGLHHNLLAHPHDRLPEGDVGEGGAHSTGTHFQLHLHGTCELLVSCAEEALLIGITIKLHITVNCHVKLQQQQHVPDECNKTLASGLLQTLSQPRHTI